MSTCKDCRFFSCNQCVKFSIKVNEDYKPCGDFAESKPLNESQQKIQLND